MYAALTGAKFTGWEGLVKSQRAYLDEFWDAADVEVEGDPEVQQAVRFGLFHVLQAGARAERRPIPAKGLTGPGYDGHVFWDTEMFALPVLTYTQPQAAADVLRWRHSTMDLARERATLLGLRGAAFPWRTIRGQECSAYWPAGTAAFHVGADIADATLRYLNATGDDDFAREVGVGLLVETARLWRSLGHHDRHGRFHIDGVTGPDEYSALGDDNTYTNLMAARNLMAAADYAVTYPDVAHELGVHEEEAASWRDAAAAMNMPYDEELGVHEQSAGFTRHQEWDFAHTPPEAYPLLLHFPYFDLYRKQVVKQADLVLAMHWRGDAFTDEEKARNFAYYEKRTVRDSSLSAATQAVLAAEVGHLSLAHDYIAEAALVDLRDFTQNTRDGVHIASLSGAWLGLVAGLGGMRDHGGQLSFAPRLPGRIDRLVFSVHWRGLRLRVSCSAARGDLQSARHRHPGTAPLRSPGTGPVRAAGGVSDTDRASAHRPATATAGPRPAAQFRYGLTSSAAIPALGARGWRCSGWRCAGLAVCWAGGVLGWLERCAGLAVAAALFARVGGGTAATGVHRGRAGPLVQAAGGDRGGAGPVTGHLLGQDRRVADPSQLGFLRPQLVRAAGQSLVLRRPALGPLEHFPQLLGRDVAAPIGGESGMRRLRLQLLLGVGRRPVEGGHLAGDLGRLPYNVIEGAPGLVGGALCGDEVGVCALGIGGCLGGCRRGCR